MNNELEKQAGGCWPEQEIIWDWADKFKLNLTHEAEHDLKVSMTALRLKQKAEIDALKSANDWVITNPQIDPKNKLIQSLRDRNEELEARVRELESEAGTNKADWDTVIDYLDPVEQALANKEDRV